MKQRSFTAYYTAHGPVVRLDGGQPVAVKLMNLPIQALEQSYLSTKAVNYADFLKTMEIRANSSNNTVFQDKMETSLTGMETLFRSKIPGSTI